MYLNNIRYILTPNTSISLTSFISTPAKYAIASIEKPITDRKMTKYPKVMKISRLFSVSLFIIVLVGMLLQLIIWVFREYVSLFCVHLIAFQVFCISNNMLDVTASIAVNSILLIPSLNIFCVIRIENRSSICPTVFT